jgi:sphinganine-1-phosphate aldolase
MPNLSVAMNVAGNFLSVVNDWTMSQSHQTMHFSTTSEDTGPDFSQTGPGSMFEFVNEQLREYEPTTVMLGTVVATIGTYYALKAAQKAQDVYRQQLQFCSTTQMKKMLADKAVEFLSHQPYIGPKIQAKIKKKVEPLLTSLEASANKVRRALGATLSRLPAKPTTPADILKITEQANKHHHIGRSSGTVYFKPNQELEDLIDKVYSHTKLTNPMHDSEFPSVRKMMAEVVSWCQNLFHGEVDTKQYKFPGMITDGGTSSIFEALRAYVRHAREVDGIDHPEIIVPDTAHVAFENAALTLGVKLIKVPVDPKTGGADVDAMERAISANTCLIVGSAPSFPRGVIDPIEDLAAMAARHKIPVHVDACLGGFLTAFAKQAGVDLPPCDFSVPNVMSISVDPHKYGQTPKGSSVLLFHPDARVKPVYTNLEWEGGMYVAEGMKGSRPGNVAATTWATMLYFGEEGYVEETKNILAFTKKLTAAIKAIPGMVVPFDPLLSVITLDTEKDINASLVASLLKKKHWGMNIIKGGGFHFCVTALHESMREMILKEFIQDLSEAVDYARKHPLEKPQGLEGVYGELPDIPSFVQERVGDYYAAINASLSPELYAESKKEEVANQEVGARLTM